MVSRAASTVDDYMASLAGSSHDELAMLRGRIRMALPAATETIRHGMACYVDGCDEVVVAFAAQKNNLALYACDFAVLEPFRSSLPTSALGKTCIRFKRLDALPSDLIDTVLSAAAARMNEYVRS
jgi:uncharacterized protein YdhG (YjbR/CyaY superfamily)